MKACPNCAAGNEDGARACARCGTLLAPPIPPIEAPAPLAPPRALFEPPSLDVSATESLAAVIELAERSGRDDLAARLETSRERIIRTGVTVAVVGEFKKGKSSLVNALVNADVCPADPVDATVAPIVVRYGQGLAVLVDDRRNGATNTQLTEVRHVSSESGNAANHLGVRRVEIALARRVLASGLLFVDTPGVGGLESAAGALNLAALQDVDGVLFVTDCSEELTAPELAYLAAARERCPALLCVMTKLDLHAASPRIAARNRSHLDGAGLGDVELLMVSSTLHLRSLAARDQRLEDESGFAELFAAIHRTIWEPARARGLRDAGQDVTDIAGLLALPMDAAARAEGSEQAASQTIDDLRELHARVTQFRSGSSRWQERLADGMQQATVDLDNELRARMRSLGEQTAARIDEEAPADDLVFEAWLQKVTVEEVAEHYRTIADRTNELAAAVAEEFAALDEHAVFEARTVVPTEQIGAVHVEQEQRLMKDGVVRRIVTTGQGYSSGVILLSSVVGVVSAMPWIPLLALPFAGLLARRAFSDDRDKRLAAERQELGPRRHTPPRRGRVHRPRRLP